ncbi:glycosyltransferase family 32 protein [Acuticoccus sp. I52.16.1]|uniref:glycosyltransferase family 32 protein n=1 Tax=Acuticoccus sp. I52.16.1 TaxID=2928472 RepID=UPI001FD483C9|nr:glycosyltransferase [Acuticoccus sp. I52.16.1]UOM34958.1 hypothetical protein MRB58_01725 [Acuticoccus sp. I52.16.1]
MGRLRRDNDGDGTETPGAGPGEGRSRTRAGKAGPGRGQRNGAARSGEPGGRVKPKAADPAAVEAAQNRWPHTNRIRAYTVALATGTREKELDISGLDWAAHFGAAGETPRRVVQFWDKAPPAEVRRLLDQVAKICRASGYEHVVYDLATARARIAEAAGPLWTRHFDDAFHPSMQADIFRVLELYHHGGLYIDADMTLVRAIPYAPPTVPLFAQWTGEMRTNVANWFLSSPAGHPVFAFVIEYIGRQLATAEREPDGSFTKTNLLKLTGPAIVARAVEDYLAVHDGEPVAAVMPVAWCHTFVAPARRFLPNPPQYKREGLHWKREATS